MLAHMYQHVCNVTAPLASYSTTFKTNRSRHCVLNNPACKEYLNPNYGARNEDKTKKITEA